MTECPKCGKPLFPHCSDFMVREGRACRGDCQNVQKPPSLPLPAPVEVKAHKYGARAETCHQGHAHPSAKERRRCDELHLLAKTGEIADLEVQPKYVFVHNGIRIASYTGDFRYFEDGGLGNLIVEDVKSTATKTAVYMLKKRMMRAFHGIIVREI